MSRLYCRPQVPAISLRDRRYSYAQAYFEDEDWSAAADLAHQTLERDEGFAPAWALPRAEQDGAGPRLGCHHSAEIARWPSNRTTSSVSVLELARLGALPQADALQPAFVRALFDTYAENFEAHLTRDLGYRVPQQIRDSLDRLFAARRFSCALDLGCGTGLWDEAFATGVDASLSGILHAPAYVDREIAAGQGRFMTDLAVAEDSGSSFGQFVHWTRRSGSLTF